ncbi:SusC/RagA family TonB-linked outer membrane protein [Fodinibius salsisoli]|uniref:TonB-dependent receptor n=1 Tax=Fodinibius salsisoli TaxID=2820877 RepID=A0ABT3PQ66_9BACT|nr:TonB-dependent receptor [Fodinibius salsisoli]MCW9707976.1 TonB-dependent receptor [Fodinibius salsisoli]
MDDMIVIQRMGFQFRILGLIGLVCLLGVAPPLLHGQQAKVHLQQSIAMHDKMQQNEAVANELQQVIEIDLTDVGIEQALMNIARKADLKLMYSKALLPSSKKVTLHEQEISLNNALWKILDGTGLRFALSQNRQLILMKMEEATKVDALQETITGSVTDAASGETLPAVNVSVKGTTIGTSTDNEGQYQLEVPSLQDTLVFSFVGYQTREEPIAGRTEVEVVIEPQVLEGEELVVVAYGEQRKETLTGSITSVQTEELKQSPVANLGNSLGGRLPGLIVQQRGGQPGEDAPTIRIRGIGTINSSSPLVLVDGVERDFDQIDPAAVESISILKDASATAVYGVRGANGVVLVTTKRGSEGAPVIDFSYNYSLQTPTQLPEYVGSYEYAMLYNEAQLNEGTSEEDLRFSEEQLEAYRTGSDPYLYPDTDWYGELLDKTAAQTKTNLNISGGTDFARYFVSGSYLFQQGLFDAAEHDNYSANANFKRFNFRSNLDFDITPDFKAKLNLSGRKEIRNQPGAGVDGEILAQASRIPPNGGTPYNPNGTVRSQASGGNPVALARETGYSQEDLNTLEVTARLNHKLDFITQGLEARAMISYDNIYRYAEGWNRDYQTVTLLGKDEDTGEYIYDEPVGRNTPLSYFGTLGGRNDRKYSGEVALEYARDFGPHSTSGLAMFRADRHWINSAWPRSEMGFVGRVTYDYKDKYLAEFNLGYNGTDNFAPGRRFGFFPAFSAGWVVSNESWFNAGDGWITFLKVRGSYGIVGNDDIGGRRWLYFSDTYGDQGGYYFGENPQWGTGLGQTELGNPLVTWETAEKTNIGFEINLFEDFLALEADLFHEYRNDILITRDDVPSIVGQSNLPPGNIAEMVNRGYEIELVHRNAVGNNFQYWLKGNYSFARNERKNLADPEPAFPWLSAEGTPRGQLFGFETAGFFDSQEDIDNWADQSTYGTTLPGDIKYIDQNGDGVINSDDRLPIGYPLFPEVQFGFSLGFDYKGLDFSALFQGVTNGSSYFQNEAGWEFFNGGKVMEHHLGRWTPETKESATYPRISTSSSGSANNFQVSEFWMKDASYLRLKNLEIGYTLPVELLSRAGVKQLRVYLNGTNLLTWDDVEWQDPEIRNNSGSRNFRGWQYPLQKVFNVGVNIKL